MNHEAGCRWVDFLFSHRDLAEVTRRSARPASPTALYRAQWGSIRVEAVFLRKSTGWCNARLSRNYSDLGGFQQFRTERQKPFPANSIGFLRKEKTRVFCEAAAPRKTAHRKGPKGGPCWYVRERLDAVICPIASFLHTSRIAVQQKNRPM